jgi:hypothetical protein
VVVGVPERRKGGGRVLRREQPGPNTTAASPKATGKLSVADGRVADLLAWRCRHGCCVDRPLHDRLDWWPSWALEARWPA